MSADRTVPHPGSSPDAQDARWTFRLPVAALCLFASVGGFVDGFTVLRYDTFAANHSANVVRIGMGLVGQYDGWPKSAAALLGFVAGIALVTVLGRRAAPGSLSATTRTLLLSAAVLLVFGLFAAMLGENPPEAVQCLLLFVCSLGAGGLAVVFVRTDGVPSPTMYQTGTVVQTSRGLLDWLTAGPSGRRHSSQVLWIGGAALGAYAVGGAVGALASAWTGWLVLIGPAAVLLSLTLVRTLRVPPAATASGAAGGRTDPPTDPAAAAD